MGDSPSILNRHANQDSPQKAMKKRPFVPGIVPFFVFFTPPVQKGQFSSCNMDFTTLCLNLQPVSHKKTAAPWK
ncbi:MULTISPECIES: hypothetical protein [unclassified Neglectibacter]|uniref:hypothetical protein n=1 Tax=unclassified Neglectibacter TaxID=2632164 RepID=UPI001412EFA1|nr:MULTISPECIES: hypothetical protein [unclassified Neglectibacter]